MQIKAMPNSVLVSNIQKGDRIVGSILLLDDNGKSAGVRPRWAQVFRVGSEVTDIKEGEWILIKHGNWDRASTVEDENGNSFEFWKVNWPDGVLLASDIPVETFHNEDIVKVEKLKRD